VRREFRGDWHWWPLKGGLDAATAMAESRPAGYEPGRPVLVKAKIRNRLGVARQSPTEFIRPGPDGKPALRKGMKVLLWYTRSGGSRAGLVAMVEPRDLVEPKRHAHFEPGQESRLLAPLESFDAMQLDLNEWFDLTKPGNYIVSVSFSGDSWMGDGESVRSAFTIREDE
jgi:hypothetical protein